MSKQKILCPVIAITFCLAICFLVINPSQSFAATTLYVGKSDADFLCDGVDDHVQINAALKQAASLNGATVYLKGPFTYNIRGTLYIGDNTTLTGDKNAVLKLGNSLNWAKHQPMIQQMNENGGNKNITICGFEMDGNRSGNTHRTYGQGYFTFIFFINCTNIDVHDMYLHDNLGDGLRTNFGGNVKFYNNRIEKLGHDGLFCCRMNNVEAYNNRITTSANSGLRIMDSNHVRFYNNFINANGNGGPGIQIESQGQLKVNDVQIYNNTLQSTYGPGIWLIRITKQNGNDFSYASNVRIAANKFINCGTNKGIEWVGGIVLDGWDQTVIEDNTFDGCNGAAIVHRHPMKNKDGQAITPPSTGYSTIVRDNRIINTKPHSKAGAGIGIYNYVSTNIFRVSNNSMEHNPGGDTVGKNIINDPASSIPKFVATALPAYTAPSTASAHIPMENLKILDMSELTEMVYDVIQENLGSVISFASITSPTLSTTPSTSSLLSSSLGLNNNLLPTTSLNTSGKSSSSSSLITPKKLNNNLLPVTTSLNSGTKSSSSSSLTTPKKLSNNLLSVTTSLNSGTKSSSSSSLTTPKKLNSNLMPITSSGNISTNSSSSLLTSTIKLNSGSSSLTAGYNLNTSSLPTSYSTPKASTSTGTKTLGQYSTDGLMANITKKVNYKMPVTIKAPTIKTGSSGGSSSSGGG